MVFFILQELNKVDLGSLDHTLLPCTVRLPSLPSTLLLDFLSAHCDLLFHRKTPTTSMYCLNLLKFRYFLQLFFHLLQVFHMCQPNGNYDSFLCPNGTIFNQQYFICDWWYNVDCAASSNFYALNEFIYQDQEEGKICQSLFCIDDQKFKGSNPLNIH